MKRDLADENVETENAGDLAVIGEGTPNQTQISIQVLQGIYHELTGKSEDVSKSYSEAYRVNFADFEQLFYKISQTYEQYHVRGSTCSVKVFYIDDTQETFSSFQRFRAFNSGSASCVESVLLTCNLMIVPPKTQKVQSYTLSVRLASRIAINQKMRDDMPMEMPKIFRLMGHSRTAVVSVKYVDYAIARSLLNCVDDWFKTVPHTALNPVWSFLMHRTAYLRLITRYVALLSLFAVLYLNLISFVPKAATGFEIARFMLCASVGLFVAYRLADHLGSAAEDSLDSWNALSYLQLTAGDKLLVEKASTANRSNLFWGTLKLIGGLLVSVAAKVLADQISSSV